MAIDFRRPEYKVALPSWQLVDDICDGKNLASHLIPLNPADTSAENRLRNEQYAERASFLDAAGFTLAGLTGVAFEDDPTITLPSGMDYLLSNADGSGMDLQQQMQETTGQVLRKDRSALFVTFPETDGPVSRADQDALRYMATIHTIDAKRIINWSHETIGADVVLSMVVFTDTMETVEDYEVETVEVLRHLSLEGGRFVDRTWQNVSGKGWEVIAEHIPTQGSGAPWPVIPFVFVGAKENTSRFTTPPMLGLAKMNRDHWRTSADHRESLWFAGQVQPWASGVDQEAVETWKANGVYVGSRQLLCLPEGGTFGFAQSDPNTANRDELDRLEAGMAKIGARFIEPGSANKTAQQDAGERKVQHSILSLICVNVSDAYRQAVEWAANYMNASGEIEIEISRGFMDPEMNDAKRNYILGLYDRGLIGSEGMADVLKMDGLLDAETTPEEYAEETASRGAGLTVADE